PQGWLWQGPWLVTLFIFSDSLDGNMARKLGRHSQWGSFLDSTLDRFGDAAIFTGVALYFAGPGNSVLWTAMACAALVFGMATSYVRAKAESLALEAKVGIATRADRLLVSLVAIEITGLARVGAFPHWCVVALPIALCYLTLAGAITVVQRMVAVRRACES
ncbi:MAG: CDP-alcohol phosphatidyltransferase family protein, partial [Atopobiaceae bacterium]|nr:CDP-alcohol phosphatidyltransferase family protein [Atopobiaceae bacterium]